MAVIICSDAEDLGRKAADRFITLAQAAIARSGEFSVALSGGSTPRLLYAALAQPSIRTRVNWDATQIYFSDERYVPPTHPDSNYGLAKKYLLDFLSIPPANVHRFQTELEPQKAAADYEKIVPPVFDLILLGLGDDGHTASLFPQTAALEERTRRVVANFVPKLNAWRLTFTLPLINAARHILFLAVGKEKIIESITRSDPIPASLVRPTDGNVEWCLAQTPP